MATDEILGAARQVVSKLKGRRLRVPAPRIKVVGFDSTGWTFEPAEVNVIGADDGVAVGAAPFFERIRDWFRAAIGKPKLVRLDDKQSYAEFRDLRRQPLIENLDDRLYRIERAFHEHGNDGHGGFGDDVAAFERYLDGEANDEDYDLVVFNAITEAARGGRRVNLGLPESMRDKVECWFDGKEVLVSVRLPNGIATTGAALDADLIEVVGCAEAVGCDGDEALLIGANLAPSACGFKLLGDLCRAAPALSDAKPFIGSLTPGADPAIAAAMGLLQRAQQGDKRAAREANRLAASGGKYLVKDAGQRLMRAQRDKARVLGMDAKEFGTNFYGGAHTGGSIILKAFGAGAIVDLLDPVTKPALPGWAGGTADKKPDAPLPPPPAPEPPKKQIVVVTAADAVAVVYKNGTNDIIPNPASVGVLGGTRFAGNGYKKGDSDKFSFGFDAPISVTILPKKGAKKITISDAKTVAFQGGKEQKPVAL